MSQESVEVVKRGIAAHNAGDMDAMMRTYATDLDAFPDASAFPDAHPCHGREEFRAWRRTDHFCQFSELRIPRKDGVRGPVVVSRAD
jgi:hypothetical protein